MAKVRQGVYGNIKRNQTKKKRTSQGAGKFTKRVNNKRSKLYRKKYRGQGGRKVRR